MTFDEFQKECFRTGLDNPLALTDKDRQLNFALGLAGEAGETVDLIKKVIFHAKEFVREKLVKELGDCLWYLTMLAHAHGITLEEVAQSNIEKLRIRYPNGFSVKDAANRVDETKVA